MLKAFSLPICLALMVSGTSACQPDHDPFIGSTVSLDGKVAIVFTRCDYGPLLSASLRRETGSVTTDDDEVIWSTSNSTYDFTQDTGVLASSLTGGRYYVEGRVRKGFSDDEDVTSWDLVGEVRLNHERQSVDVLERDRRGCRVR